MKQNLEQKRKNMVEGQVLPNRVAHASLLQALLSIPREEFVAPSQAELAYADVALPLPVAGRYMPSPMLLARLIEAAEVEPTDHILDIGCGTGYSSAILGCMGDTVTGLEQDKTMAMTGVHLLGQLGITNTHIIHQGDWRQGYGRSAPYDVILIGAAVPSLPEKLLSQLAEGGRLVGIVANGRRTATVTKITHKGGWRETCRLFDTSIPSLPSSGSQKGFSFS